MDHVDTSGVRQVAERRGWGFVLSALLDTAQLDWVSKHAVRAYTTPDSAVS